MCTINCEFVTLLQLHMTGLLLYTLSVLHYACICSVVFWLSSNVLVITSVVGLWALHEHPLSSTCPHLNSDVGPEEGEY